MNEVYSRLSERYANGEVPWDEALPPPEVLDFIPQLKPGRALDLGCGYGRASIYLASQGWEVDGVDFIAMAVDEARKRSKEAGVSVNFHVGSVVDLKFLHGTYDFALDVGCAHALDDECLGLYRDQLDRLLSQGGTYMLFARMQDAQVDDMEGPPGLDQGKLLEVFKDGFTLEWIEHSKTVMSDGSSWPSAWFRFKRR